VAGGAALGASLGAKLLWDQQERFSRASVFVAKVDSYDADLVETVLVALQELGIDRRVFEGRSVLLKPNLVEPTREAPHINTHPSVTVAVAEVARRWGASKVIVAEGPGHTRDSYLVLHESEYGPTLEKQGITFRDLNTDDVVPVENSLGYTTLQKLYLPRSVVQADLVVSLPKMKTHHWAGVTLSMKNLFGVMPGICYGWPKNVLHFEGISSSILDIAYTVKPQLAIVDGIVGMEGDGPIMGTPRNAGFLIAGSNLAAVDSTTVRLMGFEPEGIDHLARASGLIGPIREANIEQRGEALVRPSNPFRTLDS
jgi:uncharacterized protein (DUF362 family)